MCEPLVLVVGNNADPHLGSVTTVLVERGATVVTLDPGDEESISRLTYCLGNPSGQNFPVSERQFAQLEDVTAVWWRPKPTLKQLQGTSFRDREWQYALESLETMTPRACWINPRVVDQRLRHKPGQLLAAERAGLETPPTIVSNDANIVVAFLRQFGETAIYKSLSWYYGGRSRALYTNRIAVDTILQHAASVAAAPGIFQPYIDKQYELRVTIVGTTIFAARIDSQAHEDTRTDWRRDPGVLLYEAVTLPQQIADRLLEFHRTQGLVYGAYDLIVTPDGRHVFLEVNSVGQWLWLEETAGLGISEAIAAALLGGAHDGG